MLKIHQISRTRIFLYGMMSLSILLAALGAGELPFARAQGNAEKTPTGLVVSISADRESFGAAEPVSLQVTISNPGDGSVGVLSWFTPAEGVTEPLFTVTRDGEAVPYLGMIVKRTAPTGQDYITLAAGESIVYTVNLADFYDLSVSGSYAVKYAITSEELYAGADIRAGNLASNTINLFIEGHPAHAPHVISPQVVYGSTTFNGCSTSRQTSLIDARNAASTYAMDAVAYFNGNRQGVRYTTWFGVYDLSRYNTVASHFSAIRNAMDNADPMNFDCTCTESNIYAYVYRNEPYTVYLCGAFWDAPMTGTDSKAGTLIHEVSHFTVVAGNQDHVYGQTGARNLAISNPAEAIENADSHEYFAENNPPLDPTFTISGNAGIAGATLTYTGGSTTADGGGFYFFAVPSGWSGTVTPSLAGYTFTPANRTYSNVNSNQASQDYTANATAPTFTISGNAGVASATLTYTGGSTLADGSGFYSFAVVSGWSGTVTPSLAGYTFTPVNRTYTNVVSNQTSQDYSATFIAPDNLLQDPSFEAYTPNPYWSEYSSNYGTPLCTIADCGDGEGSAGPRTGNVWSWFGGTSDDEEGYLSQSVVIPNGFNTLQFYLWIGAGDPGSDTDDVFLAQIDNVTVFSANATQTSSYPAYTLVSVDVSAFADGAWHTVTFYSKTTGQNVNFNLDDVALKGVVTSTFTITGNAGVAGATLTYTGGSTTADGSGFYSFTVPSGWSGTVTPSLAGYTFAPVNRTFTNVVSNQSAQNFIATPVNLLQDPGFEAGTPNPFWSETSTNYGTPLCTIADCGDGGGTTGPRTGSVWSWFGGTESPYPYEAGSLSQGVVIPNGTATLAFYLWIGAAGSGSNTSDVFNAMIDDVTVFSANATQINSYPSYTLVRVDVSAFADGASHSVTFSSETAGQQVNINLDDVSLTVVSTFTDVPATYWAWNWIERLYNAGITNGCSTDPLLYCPEDPVTRAQMAVFLERGMNGSAYTPPFGTGMVFADVPLSYWAVNWIEKLYDDGITTGCLTSPLSYCPEDSVTRAQMAVFLLRAEHGPAYTPPAAVGIFADFPTTHWAANWIEQLYREGITTGCGTFPLVYCPDGSVTRAQMAVFLVRTFGLP